MLSTDTGCRPSFTRSHIINITGCVRTIQRSAFVTRHPNRMHLAARVSRINYCHSTNEPCFLLTEPSVDGSNGCLHQGLRQSKDPAPMIGDSRSSRGSRILNNYRNRRVKTIALRLTHWKIAQRLISLLAGDSRAARSVSHSGMSPSAIYVSCRHGV